MKIRALKNYDSSIGCEVYDIDWNNQDELLELGRIVADQCIVFVDQNIPTEQWYKIMSAWGDDSRALIHNYIIDQRLQGRHWRDSYLNLGYITKGLGNLSTAVSMVSYLKDNKGRPLGIFAQGELDWHCDQCATDDAPRVIGLHSLSNSANSQTQFLSTHDAYESLSSDMQSMIKELVVKHVWREGKEGLAPGLDSSQSSLIHYNSVPLDGMETNLYSETATGRPGIKFPHHSFDGFVGMSLDESNKIFNELKRAVYQEKYVYTQNWTDGQMVFMDQEITLHKRPTNVQHGNDRLMSRIITYLNKLYPNKSPSKFVKYKGKILTHDEFAKLVDDDCLSRFNKITKNNE
jgi:alpha-ketoglutarate-dependent taurine dioxygenase